jgi:L-ascorbate metabolism protein UlaG (beta-lactamase superfamily)
VSGRVTWLGHASALVDLGGERVLIDPLGRRRVRAAGAYHSILITHAHVDHLNRWTLAALDRSARLVVPRGARPIVADLGFADVREVAPGDELALGGLDVECVPTRHEHGRWRKGDAPIAAGYVLARGALQVHHAGDIDMSDFGLFDELGRRFRLAATLLPIGGLLPVWYYRWRRRALDRGVHIDPDTALAIAGQLGAGAMVPVHWGTVNLRLGPASGPRRRLEAIATRDGAAAQVKVLGHGEALELAPR